MHAVGTRGAPPLTPTCRGLRVAHAAPRAASCISSMYRSQGSNIHISAFFFFLGDRQTTYLGFFGSHYRCLDKACTRREHKEGSWERRVQRHWALRTTAALGIAGESSAQLFVKEMDSCLYKSYSPFFLPVLMVFVPTHLSSSIQLFIYSQSLPLQTYSIWHVHVFWQIFSL